MMLLTRHVAEAVEVLMVDLLILALAVVLVVGLQTLVQIQHRLNLVAVV
tara:strand:+ start:233 stop:379 length:147 start_codon:yes stop_codon:yes gene_type:complete